MAKESEILISFIILDVKNHHLTFLTIDSLLAQKDKKFEIILVSKDGNFSGMHVLKKYVGKVQVITHTKEKNNAKIMNDAIKISNGKYLHFLFPGEIYLSKHSLEYVLRKIESKNYPDLLCFSFLKRDFLYPTEVKHVSFVLTFFGNERFPILSRDCIFLKSKVESLGGFDARYESMESFDMISRIHLKKARILCCRRVIVDYELQRTSPKAAIRNLLELVSVIKRNFGFFNLFHWYVIREMIALFIWGTRGLKKYFVQAD